MKNQCYITFLTCPHWNLTHYTSNMFSLTVIWLVYLPFCFRLGSVFALFSTLTILVVFCGWNVLTLALCLMTTLWNQRSSGTPMPPTGWTHYCRRKRQGREGLWVWMKSVLFHSLSYTVRSFTHKRSLLAQVSCHVTALEALQIEEPLSQSFGSICVDAAAVGESIRAAPLQRVHAVQLRVRVAQHICEVGITRLAETNKEKKKNINVQMENTARTKMVDDGRF